MACLLFKLGKRHDLSSTVSPKASICRAEWMVWPLPPRAYWLKIPIIGPCVVLIFKAPVLIGLFYQRIVHPNNVSKGIGNGFKDSGIFT